jgi:hypothetical protein
MDTLADLLADGLPPWEILAIAKQYLRRCLDCQESQQVFAEFDLLVRQQTTKGQPSAQCLAPGCPVWIYRDKVPCG